MISAFNKNGYQREDTISLKRWNFGWTKVIWAPQVHLLNLK